MEIGSQRTVREPKMHESHIPRPEDEVARLMAVIQWCTAHNVDWRAVIEGRHPEAFDDPTFPHTRSQGRPSREERDS